MYEEELLQSVEEEDYEACKELLEGGADVNMKDKMTESTALHIAAKNGYWDIIELLINNKADYNAQDILLRSPLHLAVDKDQFNCCEKLLENENIDVNIKDKNDDTPLHCAAKQGRLRTCILLLNHTKTDVNAKNKRGMNPLHVAAHENQSNIIRILMDKGADWKMQDKNLHWPIHYAAQKGFPESCEALLLKCSDADKDKQLKAALRDGKTPLMLAAKCGHHKCCTKLSKAYINAKDKQNHTALHYAAIGGFENTVAELLDMGADPNTQNKDGKAPIHEAASKKKVGCLKLLCTQREVPEAKLTKLDVIDKQHKTVFHYAAQKNAQECLTHLLENDSLKKNIDSKDIDSRAPLHLAIKHDAVECAQILLENGASPVEKCNGGMTPLHLVADKGFTSICELLLAKPEVQVSQENDTRATPLHMAALHGSTDVCQMLFRKGARLNAVDKHGQTALHIASLKGHTNVVKFLTRKGVPLKAKDDKGSTALHYAAAQGSLECCKALVNSVSIKNDADPNGCLPLDCAFENKHDCVFWYLLKLLPYEDNQEQKKKALEHRMLVFHEYMHTALEEKRL